VVSDRLHFWRQAARGAPPEDSALTYPEALQEDLRGLVMAPEDVTWDDARTFMEVTPAEFAAMKARPFKGKTIESEFAYFYSMFETNRRVALHLLRQPSAGYGAAPDLLVLFRIVDIASHSSLVASELVPDHLGAPADDVRRYARVVSEAYRRVDAAVGELMEAAPDATVVIVSDHGFQVEAAPGRPPIYHHMSGPPGIFLAAGPAFRPGRVEGLTVYDVLPVLAAVKGFPVADDLPGRIPSDLFDPGQVDTHALRRVATYGRRRGAPPAVAPPTSTDEAAVERLRALGYVN
jgi:arylsulfatase A-like enzyme